MTFIADYALETSSTTGTGTLALNGSVSGLRTLVAALGTGVTIEAVARTASYSKWERFRGVLTDASPDTLTRAEILESSTGSAIDWQAGDLPIYVHCIVSAERFAAMRANHRSASTPDNPLQAGMTWADTSAGVTAVAVKYYDGTDWITLFTINETANTISFAGSGVTLTSTDAAAAAGPTIDLYRNSATPAASDEIGEIKFSGEDSAGNTDVYARVFGSIVDPTSTSEDGRLNIATKIAGTEATRGYVGHGLVMGGATGGDKGAGSVNVESLFINGASAPTAALLKGFISGWGYANGTDATNDIDIAAGVGADATGAYFISGAASTKRLDAAWAVGSGNGGLDTGSIADTDYFIWAIARSDTGVVDYLFSTSATAPTMPANYDFKRLIGWFKRLSSAIREFQVDELSGGGIRYRADSPILDGSAVALTTTYATITLTSVPAGLRVVAFGNVMAPSGGNAVNIRPVGAQDGTPSFSAGPLITAGAGGTSTTAGGQWREVTNTSRQVEWASNTSANAYLTSAGFEWSRR
jgi:hypothetical protein